MGDHWLILIPRDPEWVPDADHADKAEHAVDRVTPTREGAIDARAFGHVEFVHCGENFETIRCPSCGALLDFGWWGERMAAADRGTAGFGSLDVTTPCCGANSTLNDLDYNFPQGFASWSVRVHYANRPWLTAAEREQVEVALGHAVREIRLHL
ncbi:MAG: hypothetical protein JO082_10765 [Mycobacterium sp.]|nr:hypothetical protein [Mycobacterium sp.]MBV9722387.1 hypothetical protein [Mycobacterium sp.]